jgi:nucleotide-binding universal stress UspA family protein
MPPEPVVPEKADHWRRIAIAVDDCEASHRALQEAAEVARREGARLTVIFIVPPPWPFVALAGVSPIRLRDEVIADGDRRLRRMADSLPADVSCTTQVRCGCATAEILKLLREDCHDAVFVALGRGGGLRGTLLRRAALWRCRRTAVDVVVSRPSRRLLPRGRPRSDRAPFPPVGIPPGPA